MCKSTIGTMLQINIQIYITKPKNVVYTFCKQILFTKQRYLHILTTFPSSSRFGSG